MWMYRVLALLAFIRTLHDTFVFIKKNMSAKSVLLCQPSTSPMHHQACHRHFLPYQQASKDQESCLPTARRFAAALRSVFLSIHSVLSLSCSRG